MSMARSAVDKMQKVERKRVAGGTKQRESELSSP